MKARDMRYRYRSHMVPCGMDRSPNPLDTLGGRLRLARERVGLTATTLAQLAGCTPQLIGAWEADRVRSPAPHVIRRLAAALGVTSAWLMRGTDETIGSS